MTDLRTGRVVRTDAKVCHVDVAGRTMPCAPRGKLFELASSQKNPVAVGDRVRVDLSNDPASLEEVLPRKNWLGRRASSHDPREQVLFANVDRMFVVATIEKPPFSSNRTDRILAACRWHGIPATLVINKIDLALPEAVAMLRETYAAAQIDVLATCAVDGRGVAELASALRGKTSALYGASGVGKSSLLNAIQPELGLRIGKISKFWDAGKHTTTHSQLIELAGGGAVIDTPGIRVFRLHGATAADLRGMFPELVALQEECRFPDCTHVGEPECAVIAALDADQIASTRYASYLELLNELHPMPEAREPSGDEHDDDG